MTEASDEKKIKTVNEAIDYIAEGMRKAGGVLCPCCDQRVKLYKRPLGGSMAIMLIVLSKINDGSQWTYIEEWREKSRSVADSNGVKLAYWGLNEYGKMVYWGLIESKIVEPGEDKKTSGQWKITKKGIDFVNDNIKLPSHVLVYNNEVMGFSEDLVDISHCLKQKFSYKKLMEAA